MKRISISKVNLAILAVIALLIISGTVAAGGGLEISRHVIGGGGGPAVAGDYILDATIGQAVAGTFNTAATEICAGFWCGMGEYKIYLPVIMRS
jgi:hypothetical protein